MVVIIESYLFLHVFPYVNCIIDMAFHIKSDTTSHPTTT